MEITYDPVKNARNIRERGLSFERANHFDFATAAIKLVLRNQELRWTALGYLDGRVHMLCFTAYPGGIRVISFRIAKRKERVEYANERTVQQ